MHGTYGVRYSQKDLEEVQLALLNEKREELHSYPGCNCLVFAVNLGLPTFTMDVMQRHCKVHGEKQE